MLNNVKGHGGQYTAKCPAHDDRANSLSVAVANDKILLHCHAGCSTQSIMDSLGLPMTALFTDKPIRQATKLKPCLINETTYDYHNADGSVAYRKKRYERNNHTKTFAFYKPDGSKGIAGIRRVPYNLPAVLKSQTIYFVEGEKCVHAVNNTGRTATTLDAGANSKWLPEYTDYFKGKTVIIIPDNDAAGMKYARTVASHLDNFRIVRLPGLCEKGDVYDWLQDGHAIEEIDALPSEHPNEHISGQRNAQTLIDIRNYPQGFIVINPFETLESRQRYDWNEIGAGNLFADAYKNLCRYVPQAKAWYVYDGRMWQLDMGGVAVSQYAKHLTYYMLDCQKFLDDYKETGEWIKFVGGRMTRKSLDNMIALASSVYPVSILEFDKDPYIFNCQNCTIDLRTFSTHQHNPNDFLSKISNVVFDPAADCKRWKCFINEIMRDNTETAEFLQKALGYTLTGDTSEECFFILYGNTTRNGKGTTMETTLNLLGDYGRTAQPETIAQKHTHGGAPTEDIARLKGARFVNMSEPDKGLRLNSALVKQVTGGDTVTARFLHQNSFEYRPEYKLFINTNHLPRIADDSVFASGRVKLIPFERHFEESEQDKSLKTFFKQPDNMSGILNWFIEGLKLMQAEGLNQPQAVTNATNQYREQNDIVGLFIKHCLTYHEGHKIKTKDIYTEYEKWCECNGYGSRNLSGLIEELRKKGMVKRDNKLGNVVFNYTLN